MRRIDFWDRVHRNKEKIYQTGTSLESLILHHKLYIDSSHTVIEVGVGSGSATREIKCKRLIAVDISEIALDPLPDHVEKYSEFWRVPSGIADVVICHLVLQHNDNETCASILRNIFRCLNRSGIAHIQSSDFPDSESEENKFGNIEYSRSLEEILEMISLLGGWRPTSTHSMHGETRWDIIRAEKSDE